MIQVKVEALAQHTHMKPVGVKGYSPSTHDSHARSELAVAWPGARDTGSIYLTPYKTHVGRFKSRSDLTAILSYVPY